MPAKNTGEAVTRNFVVLNPHQKPAHILRIRRWISREQDFDYLL